MYQSIRNNMVAAKSMEALAKAMSANRYAYDAKLINRIQFRNLCALSDLQYDIIKFLAS